MGLLEDGIIISPLHGAITREPMIPKFDFMDISPKFSPSF